jgi:hypothetical protein
VTCPDWASLSLTELKGHKVRAPDLGENGQYEHSCGMATNVHSYTSLLEVRAMKHVECSVSVLVLVRHLPAVLRIEWYVQ